MTTHDAVLALVVEEGGPSGAAPAPSARADVDDVRVDDVRPARRVGPRADVLGGEELMALALAEGRQDDMSEDHLRRLARREALLHRLAVDRQRRRRRIA